MPLWMWNVGLWTHDLESPLGNLTNRHTLSVVVWEKYVHFLSTWSWEKKIQISKNLAYYFPPNSAPPFPIPTAAILSKVPSLSLTSLQLHSLLCPSVCLWFVFIPVIWSQFSWVCFGRSSPLHRHPHHNRLLLLLIFRVWSYRQNLQQVCITNIFFMDCLAFRSAFHTFLMLVSDYISPYH